MARNTNYTPCHPIIGQLYPLKTNIAMENHHFNSWIIYTWFIIVIYK